MAFGEELAHAGVHGVALQFVRGDQGLPADHGVGVRSEHGHAVEEAKEGTLAAEKERIVPAVVEGDFAHRVQRARHVRD